MNRIVYIVTGIRYKLAFQSSTMTTEAPEENTTTNSTYYDYNETENPLCALNIYCEPMEDYFDHLQAYIYPEPFEWGLIVLYILTFIVGLVGNSLVCFAIWRNKKMRTITNIFIVNLSAADLGVIIICLPSTLVVDVTETWFFGSVFCKIHLFLMTVSVSVSVMTLCAISVERWYAICHPLNFHSTVRRARLIIAVIWLLSFCVATPELISSAVKPLRNDTVLLSSCYPILWTAKQVAIFQIFLMVALYFLPLALMGFTYTHIAIVLWNEHIPGLHERQSRQPMMDKKQSENDQSESRKKAAKMLVAVVIVFGICFFPVHLLNIVRYTIGLQALPHVNIIALFAHWTTFLNSCINPVIYNFMSEKFRKEFKYALFLCLRCGRKNNSRKRSDMYRITYNSGNAYSTRYTSHFNGPSSTMTQAV